MTKSSLTFTVDLVQFFLVSRPDSGDCHARDGGVRSTTCRTHTFFSLLFVIFSQHARFLYRTHTRVGSSIVSQESSAKHSPSSMFHPPSLLFPFGHVDVHFPTSPSTSQPTQTLPRSVPTSSYQESATPTGRSWSGSMANMHLLTGYEPKYDVDNDTEITPIIFPDTDDREPNLFTDLVSEGDQTKYGSRQAAASTVIDPLNFCVNCSSGKPAERETEAVNDLQASELFCE